MSLYIRVQSSFWQHRKTLRLQALIGDAAWWLPPRLWSYAAENQPNGDFSDYNAEELAIFLGYRGDAKAMLEALQKIGFMDGMKVHDWAEYNGCHVMFHERAKRAAKARWKLGKNRKEKSTEEERRREEPSIAKNKSSNACSNASSIAGDGRCRQKPQNREEVIEFVREQGLPETDGHYCFDKWEGNGFKNNGKPILDWRATIRSWKHGNILPSQKQHFQPSSFRPLSTYQIKEQIKLVVAARNKIYNAFPQGQIPDEHRRQMNELQKKRDELEAQLTE